VINEHQIQWYIKNRKENTNTSNWNLSTPFHSCLVSCKHTVQTATEQILSQCCICCRRWTKTKMALLRWKSFWIVAWGMKTSPDPWQSSTRPSDTRLSAIAFRHHCREEAGLVQCVAQWSQNVWLLYSKTFIVSAQSVNSKCVQHRQKGFSGSWPV